MSWSTRRVSKGIGDSTFVWIVEELSELDKADFIKPSATMDTPAVFPIIFG
jgi:hypothetical protein